MKRALTSILCAAFVVISALGVSACEPEKGGSVNLVAVAAAEVGVRNGIDYFVIPEPAASTKVNAIEGLSFAGDLQELYGGENGYPQAVAVVKKELLSYLAPVFISNLKQSREWLLSEETSAETVISAVQSHLGEGMTPTFNAKNLSKQVIENCSVNFTEAWNCKQEVSLFMQKLNNVSQTSFGLPDDNFFAADVNYGDAVYDGKISVYAPDGAPALGLAKLMATDGFYNGRVEFNVVNADTIQTFVTGNSPKADVCVLPVNLAVKLLGNGEKYTMLGTLTHGNLFMVSKNGKTVTRDNISELDGKTVGVVNLAAVPGLTFKAVLEKYGMDFTELQ